MNPGWEVRGWSRAGKRGAELGWGARGSPSTLLSPYPGTQLLHQEGAAVFRPVPQLGRADGECSLLPRGDCWSRRGSLPQAKCIPAARRGLMPCLCSSFQLREDVASCQPLATALDNGRVILCDRIADPWVRIPLRGGPVSTYGTPKAPQTPPEPGTAPAFSSLHSSALWVLLAERFLVQPGLLHLPPHPQHHLRHQTHQTLPPHPQPAHVRGGQGRGGHGDEGTQGWGRWTPP